MATLTPWRALPAERRIAVIMASAKQHKEVRAALAARGVEDKELAAAAASVAEALAKLVWGITGIRPT